MTRLQKNALGRVAMTAETVEDIYEGRQSGTDKQCLKALCESHERLRAELQGAEVLLEEEPGKAALRALLTACKGAVAILWSLNNYEGVCRELITTRPRGGNDLTTILTNVLRRLDNAVERVEGSLSPTPIPAGDFGKWLEETFCGRDVDVKMQAVPYAHVFDYDQAVTLATWIWTCIENARPPWWSRYKTAENATRALALTDPGSDEFKKAFPPKNAAEGQCQQIHQESVPGWRVVEKIREVLQS